MLAQERRDLAAVCGRDQVSTVMALNPGDAPFVGECEKWISEKRGLYVCSLLRQQRAEHLGCLETLV